MQLKTRLAELETANETIRELNLDLQRRIDEATRQLQQLYRSAQAHVKQLEELDRLDDLRRISEDVPNVRSRGPSRGLAYSQAVAVIHVSRRHADEVSQVVRLCHRLGVPYTARGAGTGLSGGAIPARGGVLINLSRMNRILEIDVPNMRAVVEPGVGVRAEVGDGTVHARSLKRAKKRCQGR